MRRMIFSGFGGQGVLTLGQIVAQISLNKGRNVTWMPSYGAEMRGGTANCSVIVSQKMIGSPIVTSDVDILCALNLPSLEKFLPIVKQGGMVFINSSIIHQEVDRKDVKAVEIDATNIAVEAGDARAQNMVMLAGFLKETDLFTMDDVKAVLAQKFEGKKAKLIPLNIQAIEMGLERIK